MKDIPEISFNKDKEQSISGFELIELKGLFQTSEQPIDHNPYRPHRLNFFANLIITDGEVNHIVDFEVHHLQAGDVMVISKGQIHAFDEFSQYYGYLVLFTEEFMHKYIAQSTIAEIKHLYNYFLKHQKINDLENSQIFISTLKKESKNHSPLLPNLFGALLSIYLLKLNDKNMNTTHFIDIKSLDYFNQFRLLIEKNFSKTRDAKVYASDLSVTYRYLNQVCKEVSKNTAKSFIDSYVVLESKRLLVTTSLSVKEISFVLGFEEPTNFTKFFKKHTKETPFQFRNRGD
ncbi:MULTISPECIES: AraC family transcriptional regulator [unclassified Lentimicrobium]|uniref:AraC family transcriptional regulator n=1 Tax=unclassified Lentimicrobium TaxID=2677434 RepID=UPI0015569536|nr:MULTISPECIES: helix-turn-helix domain-containing protein [unclassified Lentimicrobium]NPD47691.1 AraC family transcriptional regulator [Lentimicrobium sp. S6]NPD86119.1 AraC family transcriptional regulator [Lentimicrobium sp. L6]